MAAGRGRPLVTMEDLEITKKAFVEEQETMLRGYRVESCFAARGCPNGICDPEPLAKRLEACLASQNLLDFLKKRVEGPLRFHHEFRIAIAGCPNACSQPQIRDMGLVALRFPELAREICSGCGQCVAVCPDGALVLEEGGVCLVQERCMGCGLCIDACGEGGLRVREEGFRVFLGGRLGRHPRLGLPVPGLYRAEGVAVILVSALTFWQSGTGPVERFARMLEPSDLEGLIP